MSHSELHIAFTKENFLQTYILFYKSTCSLTKKFPSSHSHFSINFPRNPPWQFLILKPQKDLLPRLHVLRGSKQLQRTFWINGNHNCQPHNYAKPKWLYSALFGLRHHVIKRHLRQLQLVIPYHTWKSQVLSKVKPYSCCQISHQRNWNHLCPIYNSNQVHMRGHSKL